jgi:hypothetical protein
MVLMTGGYKVYMQVMSHDSIGRMQSATHVNTNMELFGLEISLFNIDILSGEIPASKGSQTSKVYNCHAIFINPSSICLENTTQIRLIQNAREKKKLITISVPTKRLETNIPTMTGVKSSAHFCLTAHRKDEFDRTQNLARV